MNGEQIRNLKQKLLKNIIYREKKRTVKQTPKIFPHQNGRYTLDNLFLLERCHHARFNYF